MLRRAILWLAVTGLSFLLTGVVVSLVVRFVKNESGATAIEYGLIAAGISVAIIAVVQGLGTKLKATFQSVSDNLK